MCFNLGDGKVYFPTFLYYFFNKGKIIRWPFKDFHLCYFNFDNFSHLMPKEQFYHVLHTNDNELSLGDRSKVFFLVTAKVARLQSMDLTWTRAQANREIPVYTMEITACTCKEDTSPLSKLLQMDESRVPKPLGYTYIFVDIGKLPATSHLCLILYVYTQSWGTLFMSMYKDHAYILKKKKKKNLRELL